MVGALAVSFLVAFVCLPGEPNGSREAPVDQPAATPAIADYYVSPHGRDTWSGKRANPGESDGPFATVARARDAVRALNQKQKERRPLRIVLRGGTYYLDSPLEFTAVDSGTEQAPIVYTAAPGERVVLSGGRRLKGGRWEQANGIKAWVVDIPEVKQGTWRFRQLFVSGERRPRTRLPKQGENSGTNLCVFDENLYWNVSGKPVLFGNKSLAEWRALGQDRHSVIADPLFVDAAHGEFRLRPRSPAARIGFRDWDTSAVGPRPSPVVKKTNAE